MRPRTPRANSMRSVTSSRSHRVAVPSRARAGSAASRATTRIGFPPRPRRPPTTESAAWSATSATAVPCRRRRGRHGGKARTASRATCLDSPSRTLRTPRRPTTASSAAPPGSISRPARTPTGQPVPIPLRDYHWGIMDRAGAAGRHSRHGGCPGLGGPTPGGLASKHAKVAATLAIAGLLDGGRSASVPTTCRPALRSGWPSRSWAVATRRFAPSTRSSASSRIMNWPSVPRVACWAASTDWTRRGRCCEGRSRSIPGDRIIAWPWPRSAMRPVTGPACIAACREAIRLDPNLLEARSILIEGYCGPDDRDEGRRRIPDAAPLLSRQPRDLGAMVRGPEESSGRTVRDRPAHSRRRCTPGRPGRNPPGAGCGRGRIPAAYRSHGTAPRGCSRHTRPPGLVGSPLRAKATGRTNPDNWSDQDQRMPFQESQTLAS